MKESVKLYKGEVVIDFDPVTHRYTMGKKNLISVTACTGMKDKSAPLIYWATGLMKDELLALVYAGKPITQESIIEASKAHQRAKEKAASIGSMVHDWIEQWTILRGENVPMPEGDSPDTQNVINGIIAFLSWVNDNKVKIQDPERIIYSRKHDFVGKIDAVATINGKKCLLDYKTSKIFATEYRYQTAAYQLAYTEEFGTQFDGRYILKLNKEDGAFSNAYIPQSEYGGDVDAFLGLLALKRREKEISDWERVLNKK